MCVAMLQSLGPPKKKSHKETSREKLKARARVKGANGGGSTGAGMIPKKTT